MATVILNLVFKYRIKWTHFLIILWCQSCVSQVRKSRQEWYGWVFCCIEIKNSLKKVTCHCLEAHHNKWGWGDLRVGGRLCSVSPQSYLISCFLFFSYYFCLCLCVIMLQMFACLFVNNCAKYYTEIHWNDLLSRHHSLKWDNLCTGECANKIRIKDFESWMWNTYLERDGCFPPHLGQKELVLLIHNYVKVSTLFAFHRGLKWIPNVTMIPQAISLLKEIFVCSMYCTFPSHCPRYLCINFVYFLSRRNFLLPITLEHPQTYNVA